MLISRKNYLKHEISIYWNEMIGEMSIEDGPKIEGIIILGGC